MTIRHLSGSITVLAFTVLAAAPLAAQSGPGCTARDEAPGELGFGMYFDSAVIATVVQREWDDDWGVVVGYLSSDSTSTGGKVTLYSTAPDPAPVQRLAEWLESARKDATFPDSSSMNFILADGKDMRPRSVTELEQCGPVIYDRRAVTRELSRLWKDLPDYKSLEALELTTTVWAYVLTDGMVGDTEVHQSSGLQEFDQIAVEAAQNMRFVPARIEGVPVAVWVELPMGKPVGD